MAWLIVVFVLAPAVLSEAAPAGERKGFVIGVGAGFGRTDWGVNHSGLFTNFKIGYAPTEQSMILWQSSGTFFKGTDGDWKMDGIGGAAVQVYVSKKRGRSGCAIAGVGYHNVIRMRFSDSGVGGSNSIGLGIRGGFGYEFAPHWTIEALVHHGFNAREHNPTSVGVSLNVIWP
jgi:hypothetical protein